MNSLRWSLSLGLCAALVYGTLVCVIALVLGGFWPLIGLHEDFVHIEQLTVPCEAVSSRFGYDGLSFFRLALDPLTDVSIDSGILLDHPAYRQQRIALPFLAWVIAQGSPAVTLAALFAINILAVAVLAMLGGRIATAFGYSPAFGLLFALAPGLAISVPRVLTEPLSQALILASLWCLHLRRWRVAALALSVAVLSRETSILLAVAWGAIWLLHRIRGKRIAGGPWWLVPWMVFVSWQGWLWVQWESIALTSVSVAGFPFQGLIKSLRQLLDDFGVMQAYFLVILILVFAWIVYIGARTRRIDEITGLFWWLLAALFVSLGAGVWSNSPSFLRVTGVLLPVGLFLLLRGRHEVLALRRIYLAVIATWSFAAAGELYRAHLTAPTLGGLCEAVAHQPSSAQAERGGQWAEVPRFEVH